MAGILWVLTWGRSRSGVPTRLIMEARLLADQVAEDDEGGGEQGFRPIDPVVWRHELHRAGR